MKKYILKVLLFFALVAMLDTAFGYVCSYLNSHAKGGDTKSFYYIAKECTEDLLIFGSSRALHHYVPQILEDSLGMSVYNCGKSGNGIVLSYARLLMILQRYTPKVVVYDIYPPFDMETDDMTKYLDYQKRFYDIPGVADIFMDVNPMERYKMISHLYRYNESWGQMLADNIHPMQHIEKGGYKPLFEVMKYEPAQNEMLQPVAWNELKKRYFENFWQLCKDKGIKVYFAYSPYYKASSSKEFEEMSAFCKERNIPLLDYYADKELSVTKDYFADPSHLNDEGAKVYTREICRRLLDD